MRLRLSVIFLVWALLGQSTFGLIPPPMFECIPRASDSYGDGCPVKQSQAKATKLCQNSEKICVTGMWAMYTAENYGGDPPSNSVLVYPVNGQGSKDCTDGSILDLMRSIKSIQAIDYDGTAVAKDSYEFYENAYFLGKGTKGNIAGVAASVFAKAKSIGFYLDTASLIICDKMKTDPEVNCVCLNAYDSSSYMIPDLTTFPSNKPLKMIGDIYQEVDATPAGMKCADFPNPPALNFARDGLSPKGLNGTFGL